MKLKKKGVLPDKPSALLRLAIADARSIDRSFYAADSSMYHFVRYSVQRTAERVLFCMPRGNGDGRMTLTG